MELTPKEKAKELVDKHYKVLTKHYADNDLAQILAHNMWFEEAKQGALITVEEIFKTIYSGYELDREFEEPYWLKVKNEIEKL